VHDVALQDLKVVFVVDRAGVVGPDGPTHHGCLDLVYLRAIPGLTVMAPKDERELRDMLFTAVKSCSGPVAIRFPRSEGTGSDTGAAAADIPVGRADVLRHGKDVALCAIGSMVNPCLDAARVLSQRGVEATVINARFAKPLDAAAISRAAKECGRIVTVEEGTLAGGFGSGVLECLEREHACVRAKRLGIPDAFVEHAGRPALLARLGLTADGIAGAVSTWLEADGDK
jgi:1-deoxy-D-xylulose-5-phosphate synthase